jgi:hypothetical protein
MLEDAILDLTDRGDIVIDPFLGSGSTLIAAEKVGRLCRGVELDPLYVDVIVRRYEAATGTRAILAETGEPFEALERRRMLERTPPPGLVAGARYQRYLPDLKCRVRTAEFHLGGVPHAL